MLVCPVLPEALFTEPTLLEVLPSLTLMSLKDSWLFGFVCLPVSFPHFLLLMENLKLFKLSVTLPSGCFTAWSLHPCVSPSLLGELRNGRPPGLLKSRNSGSLKVVIKGAAGWWAGKWDLCWWNWGDGCGDCFVAAASSFSFLLYCPYQSSLR